MALIKNVSPFGDLVIPALGLTIASGATADVPQDAYDSLIEQTLNWAPGASTPPVTPTATSTDAETSSTTPAN